MKQSLNYFHGLWSKQQERRKLLDSSDTSWQSQFLAPETWRNLRMTCRGFFCYCRSVISYAKSHNLKFYALSPAHANSSVIEAWFSLVRSSGGDSATGYAAFVKNVQMRNAHKAVLEGNNMYSADDVGDISSGEEVDIRDFIRQQKQREKEKDLRLSQFEESRKDVPIHACNAFSINVNDAHYHDRRYPEPSESELEALKRLTDTHLPSGYMDQLTKEDLFHQWLRLSIENETEAWFKELLQLTGDADGSTSFDLACQSIMNKLLRITAEVMKKRKNPTVSFEARMHNFFKSTEYDNICTAHLPPTLSGFHPGCMLLGMMLSKVFKDWLTSALQSVWKKKYKGLLEKNDTSTLSAADENNEVNNFVGWSIFSALKRYVEDSEEKNESKRLLLSMMLMEEDLDEEYMEQYYDTKISMVNCGGLTLVSKHYFEWGKKAMKHIRNSFTPNLMTQNLRTCFREGKREVMESKLIRHEFVKVCQSSPMSFQMDAIDEVYKIILQKMVHSRFAVVFRQYKEERCQKHNVSLRGKLKASVDTKRKKRPAPSVQPDESNETDLKKQRQVNND